MVLSVKIVCLLFFLFIVFCCLSFTFSAALISCLKLQFSFALLFFFLVLGALVVVVTAAVVAAAVVAAAAVIAVDMMIEI